MSGKDTSSKDSARNTSSRDDKPDFNRRTFLAGAAVAGAATAVTPLETAKAATTPGLQEARRPSALRPSVQVAAAETSTPKEMPQTAGKPGSDFMMDVIKSFDIPYITSNPASSFRGLHESILTYGGNKKPEFLTCMHEESAVGIAHGYFKIAGKPLLSLCHGTVGLQHATMAIYNAWCDRVPVMVIGGNDLDAAKRAPGVPTFHSGVDIGALVRDFTKWDDNPVSLQHFAESFSRAYKLSMTPPYEPVFLSLDADLQEEAIEHPERLRIPKYTPTAPPQGDSAAVKEAGRLLANAQNPVIIVDRAARTQNGIKLLVELAETLNAPVVDQLSRMNFPVHHPLNQSQRGRALVSQADVVIGLELGDYWATVNQYIDNGENLRESRIKPTTKLISITALDYYLKSNYQDFQRLQPVDVSIAGDAESTLPALIEAVKQALPADRKDAIAKRGEAMKKAWGETRNRVRQSMVYAWDASPISTARMASELWAAIKGLDWSLVGSDRMSGGWPTKLWPMDKQYHFIGGPGGFGVGYGAPAAVGAALANKEHGRFSVNIQTDGDLMMAPGVLWTAVHHKIPLLNIMHNNRGYHQEVMHVQRMADRRDRVLNDGPIGTTIRDPDINYAQMAKSMGMYAEGPIENPADLGPAIKRAVEVVKDGTPAMVDVVTQPR